MHIAPERRGTMANSDLPELTRRHRRSRARRPSDATHPPLSSGDLAELRSWLAQTRALPATRVRSLLDRARNAHLLHSEPPLLLAAIKASLVDETHWASMGFRLTPSQPSVAQASSQKHRPADTWHC